MTDGGSGTGRTMSQFSTFFTHSHSSIQVDASVPAQRSNEARVRCFAEISLVVSGSSR